MSEDVELKIFREFTPRLQLADDRHIITQVRHQKILAGIQLFLVGMLLLVSGFSVYLQLHRDQDDVGVRFADLEHRLDKLWMRLTNGELRINASIENNLTAQQANNGTEQNQARQRHLKTNRNMKCTKAAATSCDIKSMHSLLADLVNGATRVEQFLRGSLPLLQRNASEGKKQENITRKVDNIATSLKHVKEQINQTTAGEKSTETPSMDIDLKEEMQKLVKLLQAIGNKASLSNGDEESVCNGTGFNSCSNVTNAGIQVESHPEQTSILANITTFLNSMLNKLDNIITQTQDIPTNVQNHTRALANLQDMILENREKLEDIKTNFDEKLVENFEPFRKIVERCQ